MAPMPPATGGSLGISKVYHVHSLKPHFQISGQSLSLPLGSCHPAIKPCDYVSCANIVCRSCSLIKFWCRYRFCIRGRIDMTWREGIYVSSCDKQSGQLRREERQKVTIMVITQLWNNGSTDGSWEDRSGPGRNGCERYKRVECASQKWVQVVQLRLVFLSFVSRKVLCDCQRPF